MITIEFLNTITSSGTSQVSFILKPDSKLSLSIKRIETELSTVVNIKDRTNRHSVLSALKKIKEYLKSLKQIPSNGIAIFCGDELFEIIPPNPIKNTIYLCDKKFHTEYIEDCF